MSRPRKRHPTRFMLGLLVLIAGLAASPASGHVPDFDGDGKTDILWRHDDTGAVAVWLIDGFNVIGSAALGQVSTDWRVLGTADFNGDSRSDILWQHTSGALFVWFMDGLNVVSAAPIEGQLFGGAFAGIGDFNGDGKPDLLWRVLGSSCGHDLTVWFLDGLNLIASKRISCGADIEYVLAGIADFDGDGKSDLLWWHPATRRVFVWLVDGETVIPAFSASIPATDGITTTHWLPVNAADFNGDGKADIVWRHTSSGRVAVWLLDGLNIIGSVLLAVADGWGHYIGDFNGDGETDLLWRRSDLVHAWLLDGTNIIATGGIGSAPVEWGIESP